ncbi:MAG TPA: hypothetical protein VEC09_00640 [Actinomycetota bacterium]|nr:hypothetical protein [Actinomycetota bacterium]
MPIASEDVPQMSYVDAVSHPARYVPFVAEIEPAAGKVVVTVGAVASIVQVALAAVLLLPAASSARTPNVCEPDESDE